MVFNCMIKTKEYFQKHQQNSVLIFYFINVMSETMLLKF